ncbi:hypothetical protein B0T25DRAFT_581552 [Lasiosphaeria hispida]|uniref:Mid2 domain-containing protein n=1 Tax=Lasiosphaeria hispida TaxID=260671 RepID=A0AAJ0HJN8_9PEZI|nr:hypothetical protein B0T25DRAFT_581552 [Lasiosphaeria hispida]
MAWNLLSVLSLFARSLLHPRAVTPTNSTMNATNFPAINGTKIETDSGGPTYDSYPVVLLGNYTFWPLSYDDNRDSFAVLVTDNETNVINAIEAPGARYIDWIAIDSANETVTFVGQADRVAVLAWDALSAATVHTSTYSTATQSSTATGTGTGTGTRTAASSPTTSGTNPTAAPTNSSTPPPPASPSSLNVGAIAGGVVGGVAVLAVVLWLLVGRQAWARWRQGRREVEGMGGNPRGLDGRSEVGYVQDSKTVTDGGEGRIGAWLSGMRQARPGPPESVGGLSGTTAR